MAQLISTTDSLRAVLCRAVTLSTVENCSDEPIWPGQCNCV